MTAAIRRPTAAHVYGLAQLIASLNADQINRTIPHPHMTAAIRELLGVTEQAAAFLWDAARIDAAALGQLDAGDPHLWPLSDMDPPRRESPRFDTFLVELERAVDGHIVEAWRPNPDVPSFPCTWCGGGGCRFCAGTGELLDRGAA